MSQEDTRTLAGRWISQHVPPDVPVVMLGGPECEPQVKESRASLKRRIDYVTRRYGERSGEIVSEIYRLQLRALDGAKDAGCEVYRNPEDPKIFSHTICLVLPRHPLSMATVNPESRERFSGEILEEVEFRSLKKEDGRFVLDPIDAFFLPFNNLQKVIRPGPGFRVIILFRKNED